MCVHGHVCILRYAFTQIPSLWDIWHTFPASTGWICFCPSAGPFPHFLSRKGGGVRRMCLFIKTGAAWIFQTGNMIPQCHPTQRRGLWASRGEISDWDFQTPPAHSDRQGPGAGAVTEAWINPIWPCLRVSVPGLPLELAPLWKTISTSPGMCLHCWLCVDGEDGWACGHTRHSTSAIKPNWRWGIKPGCAEWYLGSWDWEGGTERFRMVERCWHCFRWKVGKD